MGGLAGNLQLQPDFGANISSYSASAFALLSSNFTANRAAMSGGAVYQARWLILYEDTGTCHCPGQRCSRRDHMVHGCPTLGRRKEIRQPRKTMSW